MPASDRFSQLRGLGASPSTGGSGVGENNLAFKVTRRRMVFETFHLDVEGGTGERRTTPAPSSFNAVPRKNEQATTSIASVQVQIDSLTLTDTPTATKMAVDEFNVKPTKKKIKRVGFQVDKPDVYDF